MEPVGLDVSSNVSESEITALKTVRQFEVVEAKLVQERGLHVVDFDGVFHDAPAQFIRFSMDVSATETTPGQEHAEREWVMVAARVLAATVVRQRSAAKFTAPGPNVP